MDQSLDTLVTRIIAAARVTPEDTMALRQFVWRDGAVGIAEAESIFAINNSAKKHCPQWVDFFVEAIAVFVVDQAEPRGFVDQAKSDWLIAQIGKDGVMETRAELLLLVAILERAETVADTLKAYAIAQVERTVVTGEGPTRIGAAPRMGQIDEAEVALLRRVLCAPASDDATIISDEEARALFRIKDATLGGNNASGWQTLFVQLVGNHVLAHPTSQNLSVERARELDAFMNDTMPNVGRFLERMEESFLTPAKALTPPKAIGIDHRDAAIAASHAMTTDEANWLKTQIVADGQIDSMEKALLAFIIDESGPVPAELEAVARRA